MYVTIIYNREWSEYVVPCPEGNRDNIYRTTDKKDALSKASTMWAANANDVFFRVLTVPNERGY